MSDLIELRELRIGNVLLYKGTPHYVTLLSMDIDDEYQDTIGVTLLGKTTGERADWNRALVDDLKRITLTDDWLKDFGYEWEKDWECEDNETGQKEIVPGDRWHILENGISKGCWLCIGERNEYYFPPTKITVKYVHQLQNLFFTLTGNELIIK